MSEPKKAPMITFAEICAEAERREAEEKAKIAAMPEAERGEYLKKQAEARDELERFLNKLRGPGFTEIRPSK
jgi:hypothetical protein